MNSPKSLRVFRGITSLGLVIFLLFAMFYPIADGYRSTLDSYLGTTSAKLVSEGDGTNLYAYESDYSTSQELVDAHFRLNERIQEEGTVLLKNENNALPLSADGNIKVTLFGMRSHMPQYGGSIGAAVNKQQAVGLEQALNERGFEVNPDMVQFYTNLEEQYTPARAWSSASVDKASGSRVNEVPQTEYSNAPFWTYGNYSDAAIIVFGRDASESADYFPGAEGIANPDEFEAGDNILSLSKDERALVEYVKSQDCFETIIVLINAINTIEIEELKQDEAIDGILWVGLPGCYGFYGVADVLNAASGVNPSGSLPDTYAVNTAVNPASINHGLYLWSNYQDIDSSAAFTLRAAWYQVQNEGIYSGYKYYETRYYDSIVNPDSGASTPIGSAVPGQTWAYDTEVSYPFGYGLSYTTFTEEIIPEKSTVDLDGISTITVRVTNTGTVAGKDNVQLYIALPYEAGQVEKSAIQLVGYAKTGEALEADGFDESIYLQPGESEEVVITVNSDYYASYDKNEGDGAYILDAGEYFFAVGNGAHEALQNVMMAQGHLEGAAGSTVLSETLNEKVVIDQTASGATISNQFADADINNLIPDTTVYLSRSSWMKTFPREIVNLTATEEMIYQLKNDTYTLATGEDTSEFQFGTLGKDSEYKAYHLRGITDYDDPMFANVIAGMPLETILSQIALMYSQTNLFTEINAGKSTCMDGPIGLLRTLGITSQNTKYALEESDPNYNFSLAVFVSEPVVAATFSHKLAQEEGELIGNDAIWTGDTWWFAPGMNLHRSPYNGRNNEYYSEDAVLMGLMGTDAVIGAQSKGFVGTIKHFAFNGQETNREGLATFFDEQAGRENELRGFQIVFEQGKTRGVMTAFNRVGCTFASADMGLIKGLLRGEWDFKGIVTTDMVKSVWYETWEESLIAGTDIMLNSSPVNVDGKAWESCQAQYVSGDYEMTKAVYESTHHVLYAFADSIWLNGFGEGNRMERVYPFWEVAIFVMMGIGAAGMAVGIGGWTVAARKQRKTKA